MLAASLAAHDGGRLLADFDVRPVRREAGSIESSVRADPRPALVLFSNYLWSMPENLVLSARVKELAPGSVTVHGGPSTPKYPGDVATFLADHRDVDILVLGEGEVTIVEVVERLGRALDVDAVAGTAGTVVRTSSGEIVTGPARDRVADLGTLPSAYLSGVFDHLDGGALDMMPVETNRGCPYGCTFCDWGSATMSRVRQFPMERVAAELEWIARRGVGTLFIADANFGILPRDLEIAERLVELKREYGAPHTVLVSFAKNQTLRAAEIVRTWIDAGIVTEGSIALQTSDEQTLHTIRRKNIGVDRYDELTDEFRRLRLPLAVDLMMGLPGATVESFRADLQRCIDRELTARIYPTTVLPNSPMNDPEYRREHEIGTNDDDVVVSTATYDLADYDAMLRLRRVYRAADHFGILRHLARWAQFDHGVEASAFYATVADLVRSEPRRFPSLTWMGRHLAEWTVPPPGWAALLDEARRVLVGRHGVPDDAALATALAVQEAHLPWPGREYPVVRGLAHDYVAWFEQLHSSPNGVAHRPLAVFGAGTLVVEDPRGVCTDAAPSHFRHHSGPQVDSVIRNDFWIADDWELASPVARSLPQVLADQLTPT